MARDRQYEYVILGGGVVAGYAARTFVEHGVEPGQLAILSADAHLPYERPSLSKEFLAGDKNEPEVLINSEEYYDEHGIDVHLETAVGAVDFDRKAIYADGDPIGYQGLMIATGARPHTFDLPGADLTGIHYLRGMHDAQQIRQAAEEATSAVVIGGSFIGMEVAS
ncbi:MAG: FAD-dependent oxidoreductase, partial [Caldilineaceae bacterium]|nr:FAD-dependent oxidoreductase [Caldilineaceae bacterium]